MPGSPVPPASPSAAPVAPAGAPVGTAAIAAAPAPVLPAYPPPVPPPTIAPPTFGPDWSGPHAPAGVRVLVAAGVTAMVCAVTLTWGRPGVGWLIAGVTAAVSTAAVVRRADRAWPARLMWGVATLALLAVGTVRAAPWLFVLCVLAAAVCASLAVAGGRTWRGMVLGALLVPVATLRGLPWVSRGLGMVRSRTGGSMARTTATVALSMALLVIFGALLAGGDSAFASLLAATLPTVDAAGATRWIATFCFAALLMVGACFVAVAPPSFDRPTTTRRTVRRLDWALPVGTLVVLFTVFVAVQATVLFGGGGHVLRTDGLTYAGYARTGFWQLSAVTVLTLLVIAIAGAKASRSTASDRLCLRLLLGGLAVLTLVIVASALTRMWTYEQAYGFTRLRLLVIVCEVWLGLVFVLVLLAGVRLREPARWLPSAIAGTAAAALLGIAVVNPDAFIAAHNVARYFDTGKIDTEYLSELSADAAPALAELPEELRGCALSRIRTTMRHTETWPEWNLGRQRAREVLADEPLRCT